MAVTFNTGRTPTTARHLSFSPDKFEVYGRLDLNNTHMAMMERCSRDSIRRAFQNPEIREAYEAGRAEAVVAIRQKQLSVALAGDGHMLRYVGEKLADQRDDVERGGVESFQPDQHTWDGKSRQHFDTQRKLFEDPLDDDAEAG